MTAPAGLRGAWQAVAGFHEHDGLVAAARTPAGRVTVWLVAALLLRPYDNAPLVILALAAVSLWPERRALLLSVAAVVVGAALLLERQGVPPARAVSTAAPRALVALALLIALLYLSFVVAQGWNRLPAAVRRRPQIGLHTLMWLGIVAAWLVPADPGFSGTAVVLVASALPFLVWRCGYMVMSFQRGKAGGTGFRDHLFYMFPVYGGTHVPFGKGHTYLAAHEARPGEAFARSQLAGIKLLILAALWRVAILAVDSVVIGDRAGSLARLVGGASLGIPRLATVIAGAGDPASIPASWLALYVELIRRTLNVAVLGHVIVGSLRLVGFNVFRNTYKPLLAESVVEFWNRYYYYFKELLVEFFFLPTYLRYRQMRPLARIGLATFAAAFLGNLYYTALRDPGPVIAADARAIWLELGPRILYCFLLATGIWVSMVRQQRRRGTSQTGRRWRARLLAIAGVWTFYAIIHIWNVQAEEVALTFTARTRFFRSLFGL